MQHPIKAQVQIVIDTLEKAAAMAGDNCPVNMREPYVNIGSPCGSTACHGGWYGLAKGHWYYVDGAEAMARDLGFDSRRDLEKWAGLNSDIWGNDHGAKMFYKDYAFGPEPVTTLQQIIDHWKGVQERLPV